MASAREQWRERVARWRSSGLTAKEFAARDGVNASTLSCWAWRFRREGDVGVEDVRRRTLAALPTMIEVRAHPVGDDRFEVELGGRRVRVPPSFDADALRRLITLLEEAS